MVCCLSCRDDSNELYALGVSYCNNSPVEETDRDEALLSVIPAIILECNCWSLEEHFDPNEVNAMFSEVRLALRFVPLEPHSEECSYAAWLRQGIFWRTPSAASSLQSSFSKPTLSKRLATVGRSMLSCWTASSSPNRCCRRRWPTLRPSPASPDLTLPASLFSWQLFASAGV
jgi:hypothetical protein